MNSHTIVQLVTLLVYISLITAVLLYARTRLKKPFVIFLIASAGWSLVSLFDNLPSNREQAIFFGKLVSPFALWPLADTRSPLLVLISQLFSNFSFKNYFEALAAHHRRRHHRHSNGRLLWLSRHIRLTKV